MRDRYASNRPTQLAHLVLVDMAPQLAEEGLAFLRTIMQAPDVFDSPEEVVAGLLRRAPDADPEQVRRRVATNLMRTADGKWTRRWDRALRDPAYVLPVGEDRTSITLFFDNPELSKYMAHLDLA